MPETAQHTPGPWTVDPGRSYRVGAASKDMTGDAIPDAAIAYTTHRDWNDHEGPPYDECRANALLIAAAPDLLAACEALAAWADEPHAVPISPDGQLGRAISAARDAIAKAKPVQA